MSEWDDRLLDAARRGDFEDAEAALDMGASARARDDEGRSALWYGLEDARFREPRALQWVALLRGADPEVCPEDEATPLVISCRRGWARVAEALLVAGADPARVHRGEAALTACFQSALGDHDLTELVEALLDAGAPPDLETGPDRATALHLAAAGGHSRCLAALLAAGAPPDVVNDAGETPFSLAAARWRGDLCEALLRAGARASDAEGRRARFLDLCRRQVWQEAAPLAAQLVEEFPDDAELAVPASQALSFTGATVAAAELAFASIERTFSDALLARVMVARAQTGDAAGMVAMWHQYKDRLDPIGCDPHVIANAIAGFGELGEFQAALEELEPWWLQNGRGRDGGHLAFNAACVYAQVGRLEDGIRYALKARRGGYTIERLEADADLAPLVEHPAWSLLVRGRTRDGVALASGEDLVELYIDGLTVIERRGDARERTEHQDDEAAALAYSDRLRALASLGYAREPLPAVDDWARVLERALAGVRQRQAASELGAVGALVVEWDFGDGEEEALWIATFDYVDRAEGEERFGTYVSADGALTEETDYAPPLFGERSYADAVARAAARGALEGIARRSPFYIVIQAHDDGVEHCARFE